MTSPGTAHAPCRGMGLTLYMIHMNGLHHCVQASHEAQSGFDPARLAEILSESDSLGRKKKRINKNGKRGGRGWWLGPSGFVGTQAPSRCTVLIMRTVRLTLQSQTRAPLTPPLWQKGKACG